jgi:hypothetical protein
MSEHDDYARSRMSFRPSVYSTGVEPVQSYTPVWPEGQEYGAWYSPDQLYKYTPIGYVYDKYMTEKEESAGGLCTDWDGALGKKGAQVSCHELAQKMGLKGAGEGEFSPSDLLPTAVQESRTSPAATRTVSARRSGSRRSASWCL